MSSLHNLIVWQRSRELVKECYRVTRWFPREELFGLTSQLRRAAVSVPANIAEGYGRSHRREFTNFLSISNGSLCELETHLYLALDLEFVTADALETPFKLVDEVGKMTTALRKARS